MESPESLRHQLGSLGDLQTLVKTMKALSAASIHQYEQAAESIHDYQLTLEQSLHLLLRDAGATAPSNRNDISPGADATVWFGSDHGLCGRFNSALADFGLARLTGDQRTAPTLVVGLRLAGDLAHRLDTDPERFPLPGSAPSINGIVQTLLIRLDDWLASGRLDRIRLFYNRYLGGSAFEPSEIILWPVDLARFKAPPTPQWPSHSLPVFREDRRSLLRQCLRQWLFVDLFKACAQSQASEHASRLSTLQLAERNLDEQVHTVTALYRRVRQDAITSELMDVVSGFEAMTGTDSAS